MYFNGRIIQLLEKRYHACVNAPFYPTAALWIFISCKCKILVDVAGSTDPVNLYSITAVYLGTCENGNMKFRIYQYAVIGCLRQCGHNDRRDHCCIRYVTGLENAAEI